MAELVDASDSKSGYRKVVQVRFLFRAQSLPNEVGRAFFYAVDELIRKKPIEPLILDLSICDSLNASDHLDRLTVGVPPIDMIISCNRSFRWYIIA